MNAITRRELIAVSAATAGFASIPLSSSAKAPLAKAQAPGFYRRKLGSFEVTTVLEGDLLMEPKLFSGEAAEMETVAARSFMPTPVRSHVNSFAVNTGERIYLIDTGAGTLMGASLGRTLSNLVLAGIDPGQVDAILLTHLHPDRFGGMIGQGKPVFTKAEVYIAEADAKFWLNIENAAKALPALKPYFEMARAAMEPYANRIKPLPAKGGIDRGVEAVPLPGHTAGHTGYRITSGNERLLIWGDLVHSAALQFPRPDWTFSFDSDRAQAAATRKRIFDMAASERLLVAGMHLPYPGLGHVERVGAGYRFHPDYWQPQI